MQVIVYLAEALRLEECVHFGVRNTRNPGDDDHQMVRGGLCQGTNGEIGGRPLSVLAGGCILTCIDRCTVGFVLSIHIVLIVSGCILRHLF